MDTIKPFLVDVPVVMTIWSRTDCLVQQWNVIKEAKPSILFIQSDGGRNDNEIKTILYNRNMIDESIDWDCKVYRLYEEKNNGLYTCLKKMLSFVWGIVDRAIFLEDDDIPSISFFQYCADLLERYKDDPRIECICGHNHFGTWDECNSDYFFVRFGSIHGRATWRRVFLEQNNYDYYNDEYVMKLLKQETRRYKRTWKALNAYGKNDRFDGHIAGEEFWLSFHAFSQNRLQIIPKYNLINNVGLREDSAHSFAKYPSKKMKSIYNMKTYELKFPLKYAQYVIPDNQYEEKRRKVLGMYDSPFVQIIKKIIKGITYLFLDPKYCFIKIKATFSKKENEN